MNDWMEKTIPQVLRETTERWGDRVAVVHPRGRMTYRELYAQVCAFAHGLKKMGLKPGDHVATLMGVLPEWIVAKYGVLLAGGVLVPINITLTPKEMEFILKQSDASTLITMDEFRGKDFLSLLAAIRSGLPKTVILFSREGKQHAPYADFQEIIQAGRDVAGEKVREWESALRPENLCYILYTSGSTAFPKGALRNHRSLIGIAHFLIDQALGIAEEDRLLSYFPFYHIAGCVYNVLGAHLRGSSLHLLESFDPEETLRVVDEEKITLLGGFETHFNLLIHHPHFKKYNVTSVRKILLATGPEWYDRVKGAGMGSEVITHHYGFTEGTGVVVPYEEQDYTKRKYTNGKPFAGVELKIAHPETGKRLAAGQAGEICLWGWTLFQGYYKMPEETRRSLDEEGFFHTGDYGWLDEEGFLYYRGRYKMMVKTGGENVSEKEVEVVVEEHPDIQAVQVVGVPDPIWGEAVTAVIETKAGQRLGKEDIVNFCRGKLAGFKIPKNVVFIQSHEWPVTPTGKMIKADLKKLAVERLGIKV